MAAAGDVADDGLFDVIARVIRDSGGYLEFLAETLSSMESKGRLPDLRWWAKRPSSAGLLPRRVTRLIGHGSDILLILSLVDENRYDSWSCKRGSSYWMEVRREEGAASDRRSVRGVSCGRGAGADQVAGLHAG
jgi:hypothetical protein